MTENVNQKASGAMTYPKKGTLNRLLFKTPLIWWRMGLGKLLSHKALSGSKMLVLTSWGRISQKPRHTMLSYVLVGEREYVCSGWGARTDWYKNILVNPHVTVQVGQKVYGAKARRVQDNDEYKKIAQEMFETDGDTHFVSWLESFGIEYNLQDMIDKKDRLCLVAFDKSEETSPPPMPIDLIWIWGVMILIIISIWLWAR
ncbi:MAG: nitroreductase family deazaflavin-dependent oxidoreductase [Pseudomonadota bacterium]